MGGQRQERGFLCEREWRPDVAERLVYYLPLPALLCQLRPTCGREVIVLSLSAGLRGAPLALDMALSLETVEHRIQHSVGPLQIPSGKLVHPPENSVAIRVTLRQDGENQWSRGSGDKIFVDVHTVQVSRLSLYLVLLYMALLCTSSRRSLPAVPEALGCRGTF